MIRNVKGSFHRRNETRSLEILPTGYARNCAGDGEVSKKKDIAVELCKQKFLELWPKALTKRP